MLTNEGPLILVVVKLLFRFYALLTTFPDLFIFEKSYIAKITL